MTGVNFIVFYNNNLIEEQIHLSKFIFTLFLNAPLVIGTFLCILIIERYGRKQLLITGYIIECIGLLTIVFGSSYEP
jgi:Na+/melibiose symporter-like transporter